MTYQEKRKKNSQVLLKMKSLKALFLPRLFAEIDNFDDIITDGSDDSDDDGYLISTSSIR